MAVVDTFTRADSATTLGTTSDAQATWSAITGTWGITSNQAYCPSAAIGIAVLQTNASNGTVSLDVTDAWVEPGIVFRLTDANNYWRATDTGLYKVVAGTPTTVASWAGFGSGSLSVVLSGTSITVTQTGGGGTGGSTTDSFNQTATKHGMYSETSANRFDNFSAPFTAPAPARRPRITVGRSLFAASGLR